MRPGTRLTRCLRTQWCRAASSLAALVQTQAALRSGRSPGRSAVTDYASFFSIPVEANGEVEAHTRAYVDAVERETSRLEERRTGGVMGDAVDASGENNGGGMRCSSVASAAPSREARSRTLAIFLVGLVDAADATRPPSLRPLTSSTRAPHDEGDGAAAVALFSVAHDKVVARLTLAGGMTGTTATPASPQWDLADEVMRYTDGAPLLAIVPVVEHAQERAAVQSYVATLTERLGGCGLMPVTHVDTLELARSFAKDPPTLHEVLRLPPPASSALPQATSRQGQLGTRVKETMTMPAALTEKWFRAHWVYLRTLACRASDEDPTQAVSNFVLPAFDVFVLHLVRAGSRSMNLSMYDPQRRRRFHAKGMLPDILGCLFSAHAPRMILVPTNRTDRALLFRCRTALLKSGHQCVIVFGSEVSEAFRKVFHSDPFRYWAGLRALGHALDADVLFRIRRAAGDTLRGFHQTRLQEKMAGGKALQLQAAKPDPLLATPTDVERWLSVFGLPQRQSAERAELARYKRYLAVAYTATDYTAYGQPCNPTSESNYLLCACLMDHHGRLLEPWVKFSARGQFRLPSLAEYDVLIAHNAKQLVLLLWDDVELQRFLRRGGRVWCTMLAEYLLDAQRCQTGQNELTSVAMRHGVMLPPDRVLGTANDALPLAFHRTHLLQAAPALVRLAQTQQELAVSRAQLLSLAHRMDSLLAMAAMQHAGIYVDVDEAERQSRAVQNAGSTLDHALRAFVPSELPLDLHDYFDWTSPQHLHAYFFGGVLTVGHVAHARDSLQWTSNLVHLCHRFGPFRRYVSELHLQRYAAQCRLPSAITALPQRVARHIEERGSQARKRYRIVLFDVETTGLNVATDRIIEIAMYDPVERSGFSSLVNPERPITPRTVRIHHITDAQVRQAPKMDAVMRGIVRFLRLDAANHDPDEVLILIGHNVFAVDEPLLRRAFETYQSDVEYDGILFCDSLAMLRALKFEMHAAQSDDGTAVGGGKKQHAAILDKTVLETLTSSLRLSNLITNLRVTPKGHLHRADTDTKALWFVLVTAFGLTGMPAAQQCTALLSAAARTLLVNPAVGCFVPQERKRGAVQVRLPGVAHGAVANTKLVSSLQARPFNESVLEALHVHGVRVAGLLLQRQRLDLHTSRFLQSTGEGGQMTTLHPDKAIRQHIDLTATTTSRTTSAYPSCQNIAKDDKSSVRRLFVSRFGAQGRCVEIDYAQLEIVVLAILCEDDNLTRDLCNGVDFHVKRAAFFSGLPYDEIAEGYKRGVPKYTRLRRTAKQFSFQRLYGAGVSLLHKTTGIPVKDLELSIRKEDEEYPGIAHLHRVIRSVALRPANPGLPTHFIVELPTGLRMSFRTRDVVLNLPPMKNYPIQGYGAELAQMMVGRLFRHFVAKDFYNQRAFLTNFVHDSVWLDCHVDVLKTCVQDTCRIMSDIHKYVPRTFPGVRIPVPLKVSAACGVDMCSMQSIDGKDFSFVQRQRKNTEVATEETRQLALVPPQTSALALQADEEGDEEIDTAAVQNEAEEQEEDNRDDNDEEEVTEELI